MAAEGGNFDKFIVQLVRYGPGTLIMKGGLDHFYSVIQYDDPSLARSIKPYMMRYRRIVV